jgi:hypothetical protein
VEELERAITSTIEGILKLIRLPFLGYGDEDCSNASIVKKTLLSEYFHLIGFIFVCIGGSYEIPETKRIPCLNIRTCHPFVHHVEVS